jgi:hypothetical protein
MDSCQQHFDKIKELLEVAEKEADKLFNRNIKAASTRLRAAMQKIKTVGQDIRIEALDYQKSLPTKRRGAAAAEDDDAEEE